MPVKWLRKILAWGDELALLHIPLADITERHLIGLISAKAAETRDIEYKREIYDHSDNAHAEWLADVSSFANTAGGDLIIGMEAAKGIPARIAALSLDLDAEILRLEQIARSNLQPRIPGLQFKPIPISGGGSVLLVRIPRSFNPPHRIVRKGKGEHRFWARSSAGKYEPNVDELRALFTLAPQLAERIRDWRANRIAKIVAQEIPLKLIDSSLMVMHVVPFSMFDIGSPLPLEVIDNNPHAFAPIGSSGAPNWNVNFDGILLKSNADSATSAQRAYTQLYRTGGIEAVASSITSGNRPDGVPPRLRSIKIEGYVLLALVKYLKALQRHGVEPPYALMVSLVGVKGTLMNVGAKENWADDDDVIELDRDQYHFDEVILESVPASVQECGVMLRPFIEQLANTAGRGASISFGPQGEYLHLFQ